MKDLHHRVIEAFSRIEKRFRFVMSTVIVAGVMLVSTLFFFDKAIIFIPLLIVLAYTFTYFSVLQGIEKVEWLTLFLMPVLFTVAFYLFFLLFPVRWLTRLPFVLIFAFSFYAILLTSNIFNVGVEKSLQLYRAAFSVNYFFQTIVMFLIANVVFSFRLHPFVNAIVILIATYLLSLQLLWSVRPKIILEKQVMRYALLIGIFVMQASFVLSFIPLKLTIISLFVTAAYYSLTGLLYHYMEQKLFTQTVREYLLVISFVSVIVLLSIQW